MALPVPPPAGRCITTRVGHRIDPLDPGSAVIDVRDIAHALSMTCRFNGFCRDFYSVAEHSVRVARALDHDPGLARWGLLHDAAEAYLGDVPSPVKRRQPEFIELEDRWLDRIADHFGLPAGPLPAPVKDADRAMLALEARDLFGGKPGEWGLNAWPAGARIEPMEPVAAKAAFLGRFSSLFPAADASGCTGAVTPPA